MKVTDCCGVPAYSNGDSDTEDIDICPECGEHCEYIESNEYKCDLFGKVFEGAWTDEEANEEYRKNFGKDISDDDGIVCDECYNRIIPQIKN